LLFLLYTANDEWDAAGGYRDALRFKPGQRITFNTGAFVQSRPPNMQPFLHKILELQTFQQFIADRLDMLNAGVGFSDDFEVEVNMCGDAWGTQSRYRDWLSHMKVRRFVFLMNDCLQCFDTIGWV